MHETPTARRERLERLCEQETGKPAVGDAFLDWHSEYLKRIEPDHIRLSILATATFLQVEIPRPGLPPQRLTWFREEEDFRTWLDRMTREQEVARVA